MKVHIKLEIQGKSIDETITGADPDSVLATAKQRVEAGLGWKGLFLKAMTPLQFAQTAVRLYNEKTQKSCSAPESAAEFIEFGTQIGYMTVLEP